MAMIHEYILPIIISVGFVGCAFLVYLGFKGMRAGWECRYFPIPCIVWFAGFAVFPVFNFFLVICAGLWFALFWRDPVETGEWY